MEIIESILYTHSMNWRTVITNFYGYKLLWVQTFLGTYFSDPVHTKLTMRLEDTQEQMTINHITKVNPQTFNRHLLFCIQTLE